jgi:signal transduction histidine kinase
MPAMQHTPLRQGSYRLLTGALLALLLAGFVALVYVILSLAAVALGVSSIVPTSDIDDSPTLVQPWWLDVIALILVAITFMPVYRWLRSRVNDLVYAQHDNPYTLIARVNAQLQAMTQPQQTLPALVETIARELYLPHVAIEIDQVARPFFAGQTIAHGRPPVRAEVNRLPIRYLDQPLGALLVSSRSAGLALSESDWALLGDVAQQLGIALRAMQLTADLQASREQLVVAREEERRRIRNDLHDGLAPTLSSLQLQLGAMRNLIERNPEQAGIIADDLRVDLQNATAEVRRLVYNLRPPALDELGLINAIRLQAQKVGQGSDLSVVVNADELPALPAAVEVAAMRIVYEAMENVARHAGAQHCVVTLQLGEDALSLEISDDGRGMPHDATPGVGLRSMRERAAELGGELTFAPALNGGAVVRARLPVNTKSWTYSAS